MKKAVGIFGGTFNPVHNGHLEVARAAMSECDLCKIVFVPNGNPPHKTGEIITPGHHRLNMIKLAIQNNPGFEVSDYELCRKEASYTIDTNRVFRKMYDCPVYFIIGLDSLCTLNEWKAYPELIKECSFIVAARGEDSLSLLESECSFHTQRGGTAIPLMMPPYNASSSDIRKMASMSENIEHLVPKEVVRYIAENNLY